MMVDSERSLIVVLQYQYNDPNKGKVRVLFEDFGDVVTPIEETDFCPTNSIFITTGYEELVEKYSNEIFEISARLSDREVKEGDCQYISYADQAKPISSKLKCAEIIRYTEPTNEDPKIYIDRRPYTKAIYTAWEGQISGPFIIQSIESDSDEEEFDITIETMEVPLKSSNNQFQLPAYGYVNFRHEDAKNHISKTNEYVRSSFLYNTKTFLNDFSTEKCKDFLSDEKIIAKCGAVLAESNAIKNFQKTHISQLKNQVRNFREYKYNPRRFDRMFALMGEVEKWDKKREILINQFLASESGKGILNDYIEKNKSNYFGQYKKELEEKFNDEKIIYEKNLVSLKNQTLEIESDIRKKKEEFVKLGRDETQSEYVKSVGDYKELKEKYNVRLKEFDELQDKFDNLKEEYSYLDTIEKLNSTKSELVSAIEIERRNYYDLEQRRDNLISELKRKDTELIDKLVELKPKVEVLTGSIQSTKYKPKVFISKANESYTKNIESRQKYVYIVNEKLHSYGREITFNDTVNIVTSLAQSQFTLFSGLPGTGKTSLARLVGRALGLDERFLNISVARGWSSQRDILGYYNALSQSYVRSSTALYDLLEQLNQDDDGDINSAAIVLLDEFNLSQPEHYISPFMDMADPESKRELFTGDPDKPVIHVPNYLRFIGTINNDESVQNLTPRMIDRCSVIFFDEYADFSTIDVNQSYEDGDTGVISGNEFINLFKSDSFNLPPAIELIFNQIIEVLHNSAPELGKPTIVSYRKIKAIRNYYDVASSLMINDIEAFDYAVHQHIIPLISGFGESYLERLRKLGSVIPDEMTRSKNALVKIAVQGKQNLMTFGAFL